MKGARTKRFSLGSLLLVGACASPPTWDDILGVQEVRPTPSPPPEARPSSCAAGPIVMHFATNRDDLTPASRAALDSMITTYRQRECRPGRFIVTAHADRVGSHDVNVALSQRRLDSVRDYLLSSGIPETFLVSEAMGEDCPLVDTPDGVAERTNRRVEVRMIVFSTPHSVTNALECERRTGHAN